MIGEDAINGSIRIQNNRQRSRSIEASPQGQKESAMADDTTSTTATAAANETNIPQRHPGRFTAEDTGRQATPPETPPAAPGPERLPGRRPLFRN